MDGWDGMGWGGEGEVGFGDMWILGFGALDTL